MEEIKCDTARFGDQAVSRGAKAEADEESAITMTTQTFICRLFHRRSHFHIGHWRAGKWHYDSWCDQCEREWRTR